METKAVGQITIIDFNDAISKLRDMSRQYQ